MVKDRLYFPECRSGRRLLYGTVLGSTLMCPASGKGSFCFHGGSVSNPIEPAGQARLLTDCGSFSDQHEKDRLKGIFSIFLLFEYIATDRPDQATMSLNERCKSGFILAAHIAFEQVRIVVARGNLGTGKAANVTAQCV
jgi:hypothetical protein